MTYMYTLKKNPTNFDAFSVKNYGLDFWDQFGMAQNHGVLVGVVHLFGPPPKMPPYPKYTFLYI